MVFDFDPEKSSANLAKHGIDFIEGQKIWEDPHRLGDGPGIFRDGETRWVTAGMTRGRLWTACFTQRGSMVRIISIRPARDEERHAYEEGL